MSRLALILTLALIPCLAACGEGGVATNGTRPSPARPVPPGYRPVPPLHRPGLPSAKVQQMPGLDGVIGANQAELIRQFGAPRLDVWEGDARKLQFAGTPCVLDVYLYPDGTAPEPRASFVDARRATDGRDVDRAACIAALRAPPRH
jgi:hypothetical protein